MRLRNAATTMAEEPVDECGEGEGGEGLRETVVCIGVWGG